VFISLASGCWIYHGRRDRDGYGRYGGEGVHLLAYRTLVGEIPPGLPQLDHVAALGCTSRACCFPGHLEPVTPAENTRRGNSFAAVNARKTKCGRCGTPYNQVNTYHYVTRKGWRRRDCRVCGRRRVAEYQQRQKAKRVDLARAA
jgi:hypothetical protein